MTNVLAVADVLWLAARRLERASLWHKDFSPHPISDRDRATCPVDCVGAINYAVTGDPRICGSWDALDVVVDCLGLDPRLDPTDAVGDWSDMEGQTKAHVVAVLEECAAKAEAGL